MMSMESPSVVNTNSFCEEDLTTFLDCSERIQQCEQRQRREWLRKAVKTAEEVFEANSVTDDDLLQQGTGDLSYASYTPSMEDLLKYFEEDVEVDVDAPQEVKEIQPSAVVEMPKVAPSDGVIMERALKPSEIRQREMNVAQGKREIVENAMKKYEAMCGSIKPMGDLWSPKAKDGEPQKQSPAKEKFSSSMLRNRELRKQFFEQPPIPNDLVPCEAEVHARPKPSSATDGTPTAAKIPRKPNSFNFTQGAQYRASEPTPGGDVSRFMSLRGPKPYVSGQQMYLTPSDLNMTQQEWEERYFNLIRGDKRPATLPKPEAKHKAQDLQSDLQPIEGRATPRKPPRSQTPIKRGPEQQNKWEKPLLMKTPKKSKVQKMAEMFNGMISQMVKRETSKYAYDRLTNEQSPEHLKPPQPRTRTLTPTQDRAPVPSPRASPRPSPRPSPRSSPNLNQRSSPRSSPRPSISKEGGCLIPEEAFSKLCVKDKVLLFNKFMREMTRRDPNFSVEARDDANPPKCCSPSLAGKLENVKCLARELEAKMEFPKQTVSKAALGRSPSYTKKRPAPQPPQQGARKDENESIHVSTLTVVLKPSPTKPESAEAPAPAQEHPNPRRKVIPVTVVHCPTSKRSSRQLHSAVPIEVYAPPRKIRRTRPEHIGLKSLFHSLRVEMLFYEWMKERHGHSFDIRPSNPNTPVDMANEEEVEVEEQPQVEETEETLVLEGPSEEPVEPPAEPPVEPPSPDRKPADPTESDSSLLSLPKSKSATDESQGESVQVVTTEFEFVKPIRPPRRKKVKKTLLTWKKDASIVEKLPVSTTDSDSDFRQMEAQKPQTADQPRAKKLNFSDAAMQTEQEALDAEEEFLQFMNSPRRVRDAYTLTVMSSPNTDSISSGASDKPPAKPPRRMNSPAMSPVQPAPQLPAQLAPQLPAEIDESKFENEDQGFETGSNEYSPPRLLRKRFKDPKLEKSPLFIKLSAEMERRMSEADQIPSAFSTPIKEPTSNSRTGTPVKRSSWHTVFSPIQNGTRRRTSWVENDGRRSSVLMDVIREENHSHDHQPMPTTSPDLIDEVFESSTPSTPSTEKPSSFWISIGDITISLGIFENPSDRLNLLYDIFSQKSAEVRQVYFGIDDLRYSPTNVTSRQEITKNLPQVDGVSHYWFASGDLAVPFQGNSITPETVTRIFTFIKESSAKGSQLAFGVDDVEFSKIPDQYSSASKMSMESNYGKFCWATSTQSSPFKTSDFDPSEIDSDSLDQTEMGRLSFSPYGSNYFDMMSMRSGERTSVTSMGSMGSPEIFSFEYENEPLDKMFNLRRNGTYLVDKQQQEAMPKPSPPTEAMTIDRMIETIHRQQAKLRSMESSMKSYPKPITAAKFKGPQPTVKKLHDIVKTIQIIAKGGFEDCSPRQLESFMYFLTLYAETCLTTCSDHMNKIMDKLMDDSAATKV